MRTSEDNNHNDVWTLIIVLVIGTLLALTSSCASRRVIEVEREVVLHDTLTIDKISRDSIYLHDSVFVKEYMQGDTLVQYHYKEIVKYKDKFLRDSIYISHTDTIYNVETKEVEKKMSGWNKFLIGMGEFFLIAIIFGILAFAVRFFIR